MGKTLNIKNEETYEIVARLASLTGLSMTQAVKQAVMLELAALKEREIATTKATISAANDLTDVKKDG
jgi:hypothetical protein